MLICRTRLSTDIISRFFSLPTKAAMRRKPTDPAARGAEDLVLLFRIDRMAKWVGRISAVLVPLVIICAALIWRRP